MKEIIKDETIYYDSIKIRSNTPILEYLKKHESSFTLRQVSADLFKKMRQTDKIFYINERKLIAGYTDSDNSDFRTSAGLKISDPNGIIDGTFVVEDKRIIYDIRLPFYEERDAYKYNNGRTFYTTMSMQDILMEELKRKRKYLLYLGEKFKDKRYISLFEEVSKNEFLEYVFNSKKCKSLEKRLYK